MFQTIFQTGEILNCNKANGQFHIVSCNSQSPLSKPQPVDCLPEAVTMLSNCKPEFFLDFFVSLGCLKSLAKQVELALALPSAGVKTLYNVKLLCRFLSTGLFVFDKRRQTSASHSAPGSNLLKG